MVILYDVDHDDDDQMMMMIMMMMLMINGFSPTNSASLQWKKCVPESYQNHHPKNDDDHHDNHGDDHGHNDHDAHDDHEAHDDHDDHDHDQWFLANEQRFAIDVQLLAEPFEAQPFVHTGASLTC